MKKKLSILSFLLLFIITSCGISEDCFKGNGNRISQNFSLEDFTKVKVYDGVGLVIKEGPNYEIRVETSDNIIDDLDVKVVDDMLIVKDNSTCNITRDYGLTIIYVTAPNLIEIHSKTEQEIKSDGMLHFPELRLYSIGDGYGGTGAGTGDFYLDVDCEEFYVETNGLSNFYINGLSNSVILFFSWGDGRFEGENFRVNTMEIFHRGSNDLTVYSINSLTGTIYATGNVVLKNTPIELEVEELSIGTIIY